jgi:hypothetical protein
MFQSVNPTDCQTPRIEAHTMYLTVYSQGQQCDSIPYENLDQKVNKTT